jgi:hypothetical protein
MHFTFTHFYDEPHEVLRVFLNLTERDRSPVAVAALDESERGKKDRNAVYRRKRRRLPSKPVRSAPENGSGIEFLRSLRCLL